MYKILIIVLLISREVTTVIEVPLFRVDKFVKFEEFDDMLSVHIKWLDGRKNITIRPYLLMITTSKIYISTVLPLLHRCVYFFFIVFITSNYL